MRTLAKRIERLESILLEREKYAYWFDYADWLVLTSEYGVEQGTEMLRARGVDAQLLRDIDEILANSTNRQDKQGGDK